MFKYFQIDDYEVKMYRFWAVLFLVFIPVYGLALIHLVPDVVDSMAVRYLIAGYWSSLLVFSYVSFKKAKKYIALLSYIGYFGVMAWLIWLVHLNNYSPDYTIGLYLCLSGIAIINRTVWEMLLFYAFCFVLILITFCISPEVEINKALFLLSVIILLLVHSALIFRREYIRRNLIKINDRLSTKNNRMQQILHATSHDLKTPLRGIGAFTSLLAEKLGEDPDEETKEFLDIVLRGVDRMDRVLDDFADYSSYDTKGGGDWKRIRIQLLIDRVLEYKALRVGAVCERSPNIPQEIMGNELQIRQLFERLIDNGLKFNHSPQKKLDIQYRNERNHHVFSIRDNGIGIDLKYKDKVFSLFQRLHSRNEYEGNGVGLAVCKSIVENHKGDIWFEAAEGGGTIFHFKLAKRLD